jgi:hypothetical protein
VCKPRSAVISPVRVNVPVAFSGLLDATCDFLISQFAGADNLVKPGAMAGESPAPYHL